MLRITDLKINCPICNKPDGCLVAEDGGAAICSRVSEGSVKKVGRGGFSGGWLHITGEFKPKKYQVPEKPVIDWADKQVFYALNLNIDRKDFYNMCNRIKLNPVAALRFFIGWRDGWITIPMYGEDYKISGIQKRKDSDKRYVKHSGMGVFIPSHFFHDRRNTIAVTEGWTDTVAACEYGFNAIGKVNAWVGDELVVQYAKRLGCNRVVIFADNDNTVGLDGAKQTEKALRDTGFETLIVLTPEKDLRLCRLKGLTLREILGG